MSTAAGHTEVTLLIVILQLIVIIAASRVFGFLFGRIGQAQVCGEIAAGLILGRSILGNLSPTLFGAIFSPAAQPVFSIMSQIGLILLMFLIGLEFNFGLLSENKRAALAISSAGIIFPFGLGLALGRWMHSELALNGSWLGFSLFVATAMSITAIPILGRIMIELNINWTRIGSVAICAAALDDVTGWIILAAVTAVVRSALDPARMALMLTETFGFGAFMIWVARPLLKMWIAYVMRDRHGELSLTALATLLVIIFLASIATNLIGIFSIFGAFVLGAVLYDQREFAKAVQSRLHDFVSVFFLPIFFTYTGIRTDVGTMNGGGLWFMCGLILAASIAGKFGGCALAARLTGFQWRDASIIGVMMNTRALMELIVINVGYELGLIPKSVFFMLVLMAVITTFITTPALRWLLRTRETEPQFNDFNLVGASVAALQSDDVWSHAGALSVATGDRNVASAARGKAFAVSLRPFEAKSDPTNGR